MVCVPTFQVLVFAGGHDIAFQLVATVRIYSPALLVPESREPGEGVAVLAGNGQVVKHRADGGV